MSPRILIDLRPLFCNSSKSPKLTFNKDNVQPKVSDCMPHSLSLSGLLNQPLFLLFSAPSAPPESFNAVPGSPTSASITWDTPPADDVNGVIIQYVINVTVVGSGRTFLLYSTETTLNVTTLQPYTTYICIIAAVTSAGVGPFSSQFVLATPQAGTNNANVHR